ncbi:endonuclease [Aquimarina brevivitae]|uniref:Putative secreted protein (Por secretion system target) n=1 Tax=Aquimarina brevivitae TaxID=323412 RepID=A0A4V2F5N7_9FLAO|nr:endonuclease [Aquimarina brevivitae]RZS93459.1 putative secreted protein (Por secretion system target) [Aquimarina brevivitae]
MKRITILVALLLSVYCYAQQAYYDDVNLSLTGLALKSELATKVTNTHTNFLTYTPGVWEASRITDEDPNNSNNVILLYGWEDGSDADVTNDRSRSKTMNGGNVGDWNREHTYPRSLGNPNLGSEGPGADAHHLRPTDVQRNGDRGNKAFADGSGNSGTTAQGNWYPGDEWKGDVARMMMFMYIRYGDRCLPSVVGVGSNAATPDDMIDLFLEWNAEDPVSLIEDNRNNYHDSNDTYAQGNRNPFIDNPYLATLIWGGPNAEDRWGIFNTDTEAPTVPDNLVVSNETTSSLDLSWSASTDNIAVTAYDIYVNGALNTSTNTTNTTVSGLTPNTTYALAVLAKDQAGNSSDLSQAVNGTTLPNNNNDEICGSETFSNLGTSASSYETRTWTGDGGGTWTATDARTDQTLNGAAITIRDGALTAPTTNNGISELTITTKRVFSGGDGTFTVRVNGTAVGTIPYSDTEQTTTISNIDIEGAVSIVLTDKASPSDRVSIDDLSWKCFELLSVDENELSSIKIHPNPSSGSIYISSEILTAKGTLQIFDLLGKVILSADLPANKQGTKIMDLPKGMLMVKLTVGNATTIQKLIVK